jgi:DNA-binding NtrC family response regulator
LSKEVQDGLSAAERGEGSLLDQACGGTLFLDEISEVPLWAQAKLFELLDGESGAAAADVRVIASTSCDLSAAVGEGRFCRDLYYYLNVAPIRIPPLRQRPEDIRPLAAYLFGQCQDRLGLRKSADGGPLRVGDEVWQYLCRYDWPGNVGELVNFVERAVLGAKNGELTAVTVAKLIGANRLYSKEVETVTVPLGGDLKEMERHIVREMIQRCHGNKAAAARALGMHRRTLYRLLQEDDSTKQTTTALLGTEGTELMAEA